MDTELARQQMIAQQVRTSDVADADVLRTLAGVSREQFVPSIYAELAFADIEIPLGHGQVMLRPTLEGKILQSLAIKPGDEVLEIGTGSGFLTACLARLAKAVTSVDIFPDFVANAEKNIAVAGVENAKIHCMDGLAELPAGKFDAIVVAGSTPSVHEPFIDALNSGGRLFVVIGQSPVKQATLITRGPQARLFTRGPEVKTLDIFETDIPELVNAQRPTRFSF